VAWLVSQDMKREVAQTLQEARKMARSIDNTASSLIPLADDEERETLSEIMTASMVMAGKLTELYNGIALSAFGANREQNHHPARSQ
jgi:membrane associated rhomboid family serine protease